MELSIRTGFYTFNAFSISFNSQQVDFINGDEKISFLYSEIINVTVKETDSCKVSLEIADDTKSVDAAFADINDAEMFIKELQSKSGGQFKLKFNLSNERRVI